MMRRFCCIYPHYYSIIHMYFFIQYIFFSLIEFAFAFFICELKRLFRPFHEFLFVPRQPLWPTILSNKHKPAQGLCAEFMVHHIVCNFQVGWARISQRARKFKKAQAKKLVKSNRSNFFS